MAQQLGFTLIQQSSDPRVAFGASELERALRGRAFVVAHQSSPSSTTDDHLILLGTIEDVETAAHPALLPPPAHPESYCLRVYREADRLIIYAIGHDPTGAMYAALDLAETVNLTGTLANLASKEASPYLEFRGLKLNIPIEGGYSRPTAAEEASNRRWFFDLAFWQRFADTLARDRYNALTLWCGHPYYFMVHLDRYPEATDLPREQIDANIRFFRRVFDLCQDRGIKVYLMTWNIHVSEAFIRAHGVSPRGDESALVQEYNQACVSALLETYPSLSGIGTCAGESMRQIGTPGEWNDENIRWNERWVNAVFGDPVRDTGAALPFIHRSWWTRPQQFREEFAAHYPGPVYVEQKFNGEQMFSLPQPHCFDPEWLPSDDGGYRLLWHLRNDAIHLFRWGDPSFVRETIRSCSATNAVGFFWGGEEGRYGLEVGNQAVWTGIVGSTPDNRAFHRPETQGHVRWTYEFEKFWFLNQLWGRLGYDPDLPDSLWEQHFTFRYGVEGRQLCQGLIAASQIIPTVTAFHWNYMNGDWDAEFCDGPWNTGRQFRLTRGRRSFGVFHTVWEFIFNHTLDPAWLNIPDYVRAIADQKVLSPGTVTPIEVAARLEQAAASAATSVAEIDPAQDDAPCLRADIQALSALGYYYAEKVRGATALLRFLRTDDREQHGVACSHLGNAAVWWDRLIERAGEHYDHPTHDWRAHRGAVYADVDLARLTIPPAPAIR